MSRNFFAVMHTYRFSRVVNMCVGESPSPWQNWIPYALEHGVFCAFLFIKALKTPRSSQTPLLAIMYKQGILYFAVTFVFFFASLLLWRFGSSEWFYLPLFTTWILCQIAMSRLLLSVKSSQVFHQSFPPRSDSPHANANANANHSALARSLSPGIFPPGFSAAALHCANGRYDTVRRDSRIEIIHRGGGGAGSRRESAIPLASILRPVVDGRGNSTGGAGGAGEDGEGAYTLDDLGHRRNDSSTHDEDGSHPPKDLIYKDVDVDGVSLTMGTNGKLPCRVTTSAGPGGGGVGGFFERMMDRLSYGLPWWFTRRPYGDLHIEVTTNQEEEEEMEMVGDGVVAVMEDGGGERDPSGLRTRAVDAIGTEENLIGSGGSIRTAIARQQQTLAAAAAAAAGDRGRGRGRGGLRVSRLGRYDQWL
ncbi:hypothetical protein FRC16_002619 [Serendipita sp. 398]|nr:hypothetical protein FRC16_002619 [Serendipita sp. 398]